MSVIERLKATYPTIVVGNCFIALAYGRSVLSLDDWWRCEIWAGFVDEAESTPQGEMLRCRVMSGLRFRNPFGVCHSPWRPPKDEPDVDMVSQQDQKH